MKIAYFTDTYIPQVNGVTYVVDTHSRLLSKKNRVRIYTPSYKLKKSIKKQNNGNLIIEGCPSSPLAYYKDVHVSLVNLPGMIKSVKKFNPDIIHFHSPLTIGVSAIIIAKRLKKPLVATYHTLWSETIPPIPPFNLIDKFFKAENGEIDILRKTIWKVSNKIFDYCDVIISPSEVIKKELQTHNHKGNIVVISNGVDTHKFTAKTRTKTNFKILYVGRLGHEKGVDVVIKAFARVIKEFPQAKLEIVGDGPVAETLKDLTKKLRLTKSVVFHGYVPREKIVSYYKECDVFATASVMEVQPLTILEAMSCSLPVIGVKKAGVSGMIKDNFNGYLISKPDEKEMANKIAKILSDDKLRIRLSRNSRKMAKKNSLILSTGKLENLYKRIIQK